MLIAKAGELETKTESPLTMLKSGPIWSVLVVNRTWPRSSVAPVPTMMVAAMKLKGAKTSVPGALDEAFGSSFHERSVEHRDHVVATT